MIWFFLVSFLIYSLNITGFRVKGFCLAESCIKDEPQDIPFWALYAASIVMMFVNPAVGQWMLLGFFILGTIVLFFTTVKYMIFPNENKIKGYNKYFSKTHHIIKPSDTKLVPDTFHIALLALVPSNLIMVIIYIFVSAGRIS